MDVLTVDYQAEDAAEQFCRSLKETGFGVLRNHPISWPKVEKAYQEWRDFFESDVRHRYPFNEATQDGYISPELSETAKGETQKDLKAFYHLYIPRGRYPTELSDTTCEIFCELLVMAKTLLKWIEDSLPAEVQQRLGMSLSDMVSVERSLYRILYYPALTGNEPEGAIRAAAHEDINLITVLTAATQSGLEAKDVEGNWHRVKVDPGTIVVNVADMLEEATGFYYKSTTHRVMNPTGEAAKSPRLSMPLFLHPKADAPLSEKYPTAEDYLQERLRELGLKK